MNRTTHQIAPTRDVQDHQFSIGYELPVAKIDQSSADAVCDPTSGRLGHVEHLPSVRQGGLKAYVYVGREAAKARSTPEVIAALGAIDQLDPSTAGWEFFVLGLSSAESHADVGDTAVFIGIGTTVRACGSRARGGNKGR